MAFHSTYEDVFYTNKIRKSTSLPNFIDDWFTALETNIPNYKVNEKAANSTKPVSKGWFLYGHNAVGITYEIGDATPRDKIKTVGKVTAEEMMKILIKTKVTQNYKTVFMDFSRDLFLKLNPPGMPVKLRQFDGCKKGDQVKITLGKGWLPQELDALIIEQQSDSEEIYFIDKGIKLPFFLKTWQHFTHLIDWVEIRGNN